jgi:hypothetical protein
MFDRATCSVMQITTAPAVEFAALVALQELLGGAAAARNAALASNTPVSSPTDEARNQNRGNDDATANSMWFEGSQTSSAAQSVRRPSIAGQGVADAGLARTAGRDAMVADGIDVAAPARPPSPRTPPPPDGGDR